MHNTSGGIKGNYEMVCFQVFRKLTTLFKSLGVKAVLDTSCSRDLSLIESCNEFISRYKQSRLDDTKESKSCLPMISSACPGMLTFLMFADFGSTCIKPCVFNDKCY